MKPKIICLILLSTISVIGTANNNSAVPMLPEFPCKSPEAFAFQRYGEFQLDGYTGNPGIAIPLYSLTYKDITIPLTLSYEGTGVKVRQESSWVGLGWNMNVGGCINYVSQGANDQSFARSARTEEYLKLCNIRNGNQYQLYTSLDRALTDSQIGYTPSNSLVTDLRNNLGERDFYSVSFLGHSFLFFINPSDNQITVLGEESQKYQVNRVNKDWVITDVNGYSYSFTVTEYSYEGGSTCFISAWNLSSIESPTGAYVTFTYTNDYSSFSFIPDIQQSYEIEKSDQWTAGYQSPGYRSSIVSGTWKVDKKYLVGITGGDDVVKVSFGYSDRIDLPGSKKIDEITISSLSNNGYKKFKLNYDYFDACKVGGSYLYNLPGQQFDKIEDRYKKRLKLLSLSEISSDRKDTITTSFEYYGDDTNSKLPMKTSCAIDFWGYYNGAENAVETTQGIITGERHILLPSLADCYGQSNIQEIDKVKDRIQSVKGANRFCNENYMKTGTLKKIIYPTKGYSLFEYEAHRFLADEFRPYVFKESGPASRGTTYTAWDINSSNPNSYLDYHKSFNVTSPSTGTITIKMTADTPEKMQLLRRSNPYVEFISNNVMETYRINSLTESASGLELTKYIHNIDLTPSTSYHLIAILPDNVGSGCKVSISINVHSKLTETDKQSIGGGLRIKSIANYDSNNALLQTRRYEYEDGKSLVPMKLFNIVRRHTYCDVSMPGMSGTYSNMFLVFHSSLIGNSSFTSSVSKGIIGYSSVTEKITDASNALKKRIVTTYQNKFATEVLGDFYQFDNYSNGNILTRCIYDGAGTMVESIVNSYTLKSSNVITCNLKLEDLITDPRCELAGSYRLIAYSYQSKWNVLSKTKHLLYLPNGIVSTETSYSYNNQNHLVSEEILKDSQGAVLEQRNYRYPCDFTRETVCKSMTDNHYLSPVIEEIYKIQGKEKYRKRAVYSSSRGLFLHNRDSISLNGGPMEKRMEYTYNFQYGNLMGVIKDNAESVTYLWSYKHSLPVAEIKGATYSQVLQWLGSSKINGISASSSFTEEQALSIQRDLAAHGAITTMYLHDPIWGVTSQILPNGVKTNFQYDKFGRLREIKDKNEHSIKSFDYNYNK